MKALAGRKSDGRDAQRISEFLHDGRLDGSFVPNAEVRQSRTMLRHRVSLLEQGTGSGIFRNGECEAVLGGERLSRRRILEALIAREDSLEILS